MRGGQKGSIQQSFMLITLRCFRTHGEPHAHGRPHSLGGTLTYGRPIALVDLIPTSVIPIGNCLRRRSIELFPLVRTPAYLIHSNGTLGEAGLDVERAEEGGESAPGEREEDAGRHPGLVRARPELLDA